MQNGDAGTTRSHRSHFPGSNDLLATRRRVSLSDLYADACRRVDVTPEEAVGCERIADRLRLMVTKDKTVEFLLVDDPESDRLILGPVVEE